MGIYPPGDVTQLAGHIATLTGDEVLTRDWGGRR
jgi:hypothetical protein